jgi:hypothetical protein
VTELEAAAVAEAMRLVLSALLTKKVSPEDITKSIEDMIWKAVREEV